MKRVKSKDLKILIAIYYSRFLDPYHKPINDIIDDRGEIKIDINSVYINVYDISSNNFGPQSSGDMEKFSKMLEDVTSGNLKVTYFDSLSIDIANSYEVDELN